MVTNSSSSSSSSSKHFIEKVSVACALVIKNNIGKKTNITNGKQCWTAQYKVLCYDVHFNISALMDINLFQVCSDVCLYRPFDKRQQINKENHNSNSNTQ